MKYILSICIVLLTITSGCTNNTINSNIMELSAIEEIDIANELNIIDNQTYDILDYQDGKALILISDKSINNPLDINDQVVTTYYQNFVEFEISTGDISNSYEIEQFGICTGALSIYDGVLLSFFNIDEENELNSAIYFLNSDGMNSIYECNFSLFGLGPVLHRHNDNALFSYYDNNKNSFGLMAIDSNFNVNNVISCDPNDVDYISDDFKTSDNYYAYAVGINSAVTFYIGNNYDSFSSVSLPQGVKIHDFTINDKMLVISIAENNSSFDDIVLFDLEMNQFIETNEYDSLPTPLYSIAVDDNGLLCGFNYSTMKILELGENIQEISFDAIIQGDFQSIFQDDKTFLVVTRSYDSMPKVWHITK